MANNPKNYNDTSPAIPSGKAGVKWQAATPDVNPAVVRDVSAYVDPCTATAPGAVPTPPNDASQFLDGTGVFSTPSASLSNPMTTPGDLIVGGTSGTPTRLGIGSAGQVPTVVTGAIAWQTPAGGGGGASPLTNVVLIPAFTGANNYGTPGNFTVFGKLASRLLVLNPTTWKFSIVSGAATGLLGAAVVYRTLKDSATIIDSTAVTFSGISTVSLPAAEVFSDSIALAIDMIHDYYIAVWFDGAGGVASIQNFSTPTNVPGVIGGYISGNSTTLTGGGSIPALTSVECILSQVVALS